MLVAVQAYRRAFRGRLTIIEPRERLGAGLAYATSFDQHLLNVPAGKMSALDDAPEHFLEWLRTRHWPGAAPDAFAPRKLYGEYLLELLQETIGAAGSDFHHIRAEAISASTDRAAHFWVSVMGQRFVREEWCWHWAIRLRAPSPSCPRRDWEIAGNYRHGSETRCR